MEGQGEKLCRQMVKYSHTYGVTFVGACDGMSLVLDVLGGDPNMYYNEIAMPSPVPGKFLFVWEEERQFMKRSLFVWLKYALRLYLEEHHIEVI